MKAISIQQPWAWAILHAGKDIENRSWTTSFRGRIAVHATRLQPRWKLPPGVRPPREGELVLGAILGTVELVDVVRESRSPWFIGPYGFVLRNPRPLPQPIPCRGNLRLWTLPPELEQAFQEAKVEPGNATQKEKRVPVAARLLKVTQGNVNNGHLYLTNALDLFPQDVLGGAHRGQAGRSVQVYWDDGTVDTDVVKSRKIFRRRDWVRRFFRAEQVAAGDEVLLEQLEPYVYRIRKWREQSHGSTRI